MSNSVPKQVVDHRDSLSAPSDVQNVVNEYILLSCSEYLTDAHAERMSQILEQALNEPELSFWLEEMDYTLALKQELVTPCFIEEQQDKTRGVISQSSLDIERLNPMNDNLGGTQDNNDNTAVTVEFPESEFEILKKLSHQKEMSERGIIRHALRLLDFIEDRINKGEEFFLESPGKDKEKVF